MHNMKNLITWNVLLGFEMLRLLLPALDVFLDMKVATVPEPVPSCHACQEQMHIFECWNHLCTESVSDALLSWSTLWCGRCWIGSVHTNSKTEGMDTYTMQMSRAHTNWMCTSMFPHAPRWFQNDLETIPSSFDSASSTSESASGEKCIRNAFCA